MKRLNMVLHSGTNFNLDIGAFWCSQFLVHWDFDCVQEQLSGAMCYKLCMAYHVCLSSLYAPLTTTVFDGPFFLVSTKDQHRAQSIFISNLFFLHIQTLLIVTMLLGFLVPFPNQFLSTFMVTRLRILYPSYDIIDGWSNGSNK